jgi:hypothetical protein
VDKNSELHVYLYYPTTNYWQLHDAGLSLLYNTGLSPAQGPSTQTSGIYVGEGLILRSSVAYGMPQFGPVTRVLLQGYAATQGGYVWNWSASNRQTGTLTGAQLAGFKLITFDHTHLNAIIE